MPFSDECHHLFKDFELLVENYVLPTPTAIKSSQSLLIFSDLRSYLLLAYLRGHVVWRAAEGVGGLVEVDLELAHPKVDDSYVTLVVQQEVVQLQVPEKQESIKTG